MEVLLREDVDNLGARGDVVKVRAGYGRNYLLPQGLAVQATPSNVKQIEMQRKALLKKAAAEKSSAEGQAALIKEITLTFDRKVGEHGILFGSVTSMDIAEALAAKGYEIDRKRINLADTIKEVGEYEVPVKLHREVTATIKVVVRKEGEEAAA
ncbi:MAG TPA: 50S ribosomal protein L9 [Blastocatellia bacterium]|nr:50S ribosomal protein L9 [Blastocatellia bacterium]